MALHQLNNYLLLGLFSLLVLMPGIAKMPVIDRDEAHFAQASRQMVQTGNFFQIHFQDTQRFRKPPGINWLQAASVKLFGNANESKIWPYRIPSLLGALLSILLSYFFFRRFVGQTHAILAAALLASTLLLVVESHMAVIDTSLLSSVVLMQGALWIIYQGGTQNKPVPWGWAACFWLAMTYGCVLKGVTPLVGVLSIIALCIIEKQVKWLSKLHLISGLLLFTMLSLTWVFLMNSAENSNFLFHIIHNDLLPKLKGGHESHGKPPLFHLFILPVTFWPASLFLWQAGRYAVRNRHDSVVKFLLAWILPTWIFFELMPTKLPQYILPTFPAIALLCALAIRTDNENDYPGKWLHLLQFLWIILSLGLALSLVGLPYLVTQQLTTISLVLFSAISLLSITAVYFAWNGFYQRASLITLSIAVISYSLIFSNILPQLKPVWLTKNITQLIDKKIISNDKPLLVVGFDEPSLVFNLNTQLIQFVTSLDAEKILQADSSRLAVIESKVFAGWMSYRPNIIVLAQTRGFNYSKGRWLELLVVGQQKFGARDVAI